MLCPIIGSSYNSQKRIDSFLSSLHDHIVFQPKRLAGGHANRQRKVFSWEHDREPLAGLYHLISRLLILHSNTRRRRYLNPGVTRHYIEFTIPIWISNVDYKVTHQTEMNPCAPRDIEEQNFQRQRIWGMLKTPFFKWYETLKPSSGGRYFC